MLSKKTFLAFLFIFVPSTSSQYSNNRHESLTPDNSTNFFIGEKRSPQQFQQKRKFGIELFVVVDYSIYRKWYVYSRAKDTASKRAQAIRNIRYYFTHVVHEIDDRYRSIHQPDMEFYVQLSGIYIAQTAQNSPFTEKYKVDSETIDAYDSLDEFQRWIKRQNESLVKTLPNYDSAALFTNYNLFSKRNNTIIFGLADIKASCTDKGTSINKDQLLYTTVGTSSHELGHNMGASHDSPEYNSCSIDEQFIMASAPGSFDPSNYMNSYTFSSCSIEHFRKYISYLDMSNTNCLLNTPVNPFPRSTFQFLQTLPGQRFSIDDQCKILMGPSFSYCAGGGKRDEEICSSLVCYDPARQKCLRQDPNRAFDGTPCGNKKWCHRSVCQHNDKAPRKLRINCIYGDLKESFVQGKRKATCKEHVRLSRANCYLDHFKKQCCVSCAQAYNASFPDCPYGDKEWACETRKAYHCYEKDKNNIKSGCCDFCRKHEKNHLPPDCKYGDKGDFCSTMDIANCYNGEHICCEFCAKHALNIPNCKYGDIFKTCTIAHCSNKQDLAGCCYTCRNFKPIPTTTTPSPKTSKNCPKGDAASWCKKIPKRDCYHRKSQCCQTCQDFADPSNRGCEYGDRWRECKNHAKGFEDCQRSNIAKGCCATCKHYPKPPPKTYDENQNILCTTLKPHQCYVHNKKCPKACQKYYNAGFKGCEYGDRVKWCASHIVSYEQCKKPRMLNWCCSYCQVLKQKYQRDGGREDKAPWCKSVFAGQCYRPKIEETCALSCHKHRNNRNGACRYGDYYEWCSKAYCPSGKKDCCASCSP